MFLNTIKSWKQDILPIHGGWVCVCLMATPYPYIFSYPDHLMFSEQTHVCVCTWSLRSWMGPSPPALLMVTLWRTWSGFSPGCSLVTYVDGNTPIDPTHFPFHQSLSELSINVNLYPALKFQANKNSKKWSSSYLLRSTFKGRLNPQKRMSKRMCLYC